MIKARVTVTLKNGVLDPQGNPFMTIGAAGVAPGDALEDVIRRADGALYRGKGQGRNQVVFEEAGGG